MQIKFFLAASAVAMGAASFTTEVEAQSTGSVEFEKEIVVTGSRADKGVGGVDTPDTSKAKGVLSQEFIARQTPGQTILDTINQLPGVNFQNNDPFGSAGGTLSIRGFDSSRISLTFDGIPLNDTGNYAVFSNQQLDPELIEQANVNYGSTDVDSPSAAASGSTVNYRSRTPSKDFGVRVVGSAGDFKFFRVFGLVDTGEFTAAGTRAWFSASSATNNWFVNDFGKINKQQYNGKLYQPIGDNGDFISVSGNWNQNRNNFGGSAPLRTDSNILTQSITAPNSAANPLLLTGALRTPGTSAAASRFPISQDEVPYHVARCQITAGRPGLADTDTATGCGTSFDERYNPSNTGSIRFNSKFHLASNLVLTIDPSFQYVKANGGGTVLAREGLRDINPGLSGTPAVANASTAVCAATPNATNIACRVGYFAGLPFAGRDLNGDGDLLDIVNVLAPSQTQTNRYGLLASLKYEISDEHTVRLSYSFDRGRHRQTGEVGFLQSNGFPTDVFPVNDPIKGSNGEILQKRDRLSIATLNQVSAEYRGEFFDGNFTLTAGVRAPFFKRDLTNYCFTSSAAGFVECFGRDATLQTELTTLNPYSVNATTGVPVAGSFATPQNRVYKYNRILPNVGYVYKMGAFSIFGNYSKGLQVPGTDNLYQAFFFPRASAQANPAPETTDNFDMGVRYRSSNLQAEITPWYTKFTNRLASAFDPDTQQTVYRNLGRVDKYGIDGSIDYRPVPEVLIHVFGSYLKSDIKNNVQLGNCPTTLTAANTTLNCTVAGAPIFALTAGKRESAASVYSYGGRIQGSFGPIDLGLQVKRTGPRYLNDQNLSALACTAALVNFICPTAANTPTTFTGTRGFQYVTYDAKAPGYTTIDFDARVNMEWAGLNKKTYLQLNVQNVTNHFYVGGFGGGSTTQFATPFAQIGVPRTFIATLNVGF